jgi:hypothetical protein
LHVLTFVELWNFLSFFSCFSILCFYFSTFFYKIWLKSSITARTSTSLRGGWRKTSIGLLFVTRGIWQGPPPEKVPRTSRADSCAPPKGDEPYFHREASAQPQSGNASIHGAIPVIVNQVPSQEGNAAPVVVSIDQPTNGSYANERGVDPEGFEHGADYGGYVATNFNSSLVSDSEAASRSEYRYQRVQGQASRTPAYGDPCGRPRSSARSKTLRTSFDSREGESQSLQVLGRIEDVMTRMERQFSASTSAIASLSAAHSTPSSPGEFHSFIFTLNC